MTVELKEMPPPFLGWNNREAGKAAGEGAATWAVHPLWRAKQFLGCPWEECEYLEIDVGLVLVQANTHGLQLLLQKGPRQRLRVSLHRLFLSEPQSVLMAYAAPIA